MKNTQASTGRAPILLAALALVACTDERYEIEIRATETGQERTIQWSRSTFVGPNAGKPVQAEVTELAEIYAVDAPDRAVSSFEATASFGAQTPADIGGAGRLVTLRSPLGYVRTYLERFRGRDDLVALAAERTAAVDALVDLFLDYFEFAGGEAPDWPRLRAYVDGELRADLINLAHQAWTCLTPMTADEVDTGCMDRRMNEGMARMLWSLAERGSFSEPTLTGLLAGGWNIEVGQSDLFPGALRELLLRRPGLDNELGHAQFPFIVEANQDGESWKRFLDANVDQLRALRTRFSDETPATGAPPALDTDEETPDDVASSTISALLSRALGDRFLAEHDIAVVRLHCPVEPHGTNGRWMPGENEVRFNVSLPDQPNHTDWYSSVLYATWAEPDEDGQRELLGATLGGENLAEFTVLWSTLAAPDRSRLLELLGAAPRPLTEDHVDSMIGDLDEGDRLIAILGTVEPD